MTLQLFKISIPKEINDKPQQITKKGRKKKIAFLNLNPIQTEIIPITYSHLLILMLQFFAENSKELEVVYKCPKTNMIL